MVDATVLFAGIGWPRWSYEILRHAVRGDFQLFLSPLVVEQARRNLQDKLPNHVRSFETWLSLAPYKSIPDPEPAEVLENQSLVRDISDVPIALSAIHAHVSCLVSDDKDLTEEAATRSLRQHLSVMRPVIFLREVMGWSREDLEKIRYRNWPLE